MQNAKADVLLRKYKISKEGNQKAKSEYLKATLDVIAAKAAADSG